ncbi:HU family DNA-binding protein [Bacteroides hominis]|uniref:HU family DNA-binding protein n=1 Tax=Bacteroides hominis TaxID=2763023 RepID=UPI0022A23EF5|nr:HU family DNA-binding protein [Bacteroides fragilis]
MSINYAVTKKVDKSKGIAKERYYATTRALQKKPVNSVQIANQLAERSSLQNGDVLSALTQLSDIIAAHLKEGRTVSIDGLGNFYPSITSEAVDKPEECTANKVWVSRICFKAAPTFLNNVRKTDFVSLQLKYGRKSAKPQNGSDKETTDAIPHQQSISEDSSLSDE